ncbi:MAG TPA: hypothetical protein VL094_10930 [Sphingomonadaceae bacterium]|nr:hypothetical protein [Sphingomonadaceae bacterium]
MNSFAAFLAPLALLFPVGLDDASHVSGGGKVRLVAEDSGAGGSLGTAVEGSFPSLSLGESALPDENAQVRIEQSVTIRISPRAAASQRDILAQLPQGRSSTHVEERKFGNCISAEGIAGVATSADNRLLLFMRDRKVISAALEKACSARDFYSGFYVQHTEDGMLCVKRDKIHSRAGAKCELKQFRQLVAVRD